jgi:hypothetical protein
MNIHPTYNNILILFGSTTLNITNGLQGKARTDEILAIKNKKPILFACFIFSALLFFYASAT